MLCFTYTATAGRVPHISSSKTAKYQKNELSLRQEKTRLSDFFILPFPPTVCVRIWICFELGSGFRIKNVALEDKNTYAPQKNYKKIFLSRSFPSSGREVPSGAWMSSHRPKNDSIFCFIKRNGIFLTIYRYLLVIISAFESGSIKIHGCGSEKYCGELVPELEDPWV